MAERPGKRQSTVYAIVKVGKSGCTLLITLEAWLTNSWRCKPISILDLIVATLILGGGDQLGHPLPTERLTAKGKAIFYLFSPYRPRVLSTIWREVALEYANDGIQVCLFVPVVF